METTGLRLIWELAIPLADAWLELAERKERQKYQQTDSEDLRASFRAIRKREILDDLLHKKRVAIGIKKNPPNSAPIEIVPNHLFNADSEIDWLHGRLEFSNIQFVQIRITDDLEYPEKLPDLNNNNFDILKNKPGPKSAGDYIRKEYRRMQAEGILDKCKSMKEIHNKMWPVLAKQKDLFPLGRGLSYPSFARHLKEVLITFK